MPQRPNDSLNALLHEAEAELSRRLQEACEAESKGVATESAEEIRRLEDTLLSAAMAAERTIAARRHLRDSTQAAEPSTKQSSAREHDAPPPARKDAAVDPVSPSSTSVREFEDRNGKSWRAWPVTPELSHTRTASRRSLGDFQEGWICFEALDNSGRRRLPRLGRRWSDLSAEELPRLLEEAIAVPARKPVPPQAASRADIGKLN